MNCQLSCRICLEKLESGEMVSLFDRDENTEQLVNKYTYCCGIAVSSTDSLPTLICLPCLDKLTLAYQFKQTCVTSNETLKECLQEFRKSSAAAGSTSEDLAPYTRKKEKQKEEEQESLTTLLADALAIKDEPDDEGHELFKDLIANDDDPDFNPQEEEEVEKPISSGNTCAKLINMADKISNETLQEEIEKILKNTDLAKTSTRKVIQELEKKLHVQLGSRKLEIDKIVMDYVNSIAEESDNSDEKPRKTRGAATRKNGFLRGAATRKNGFLRVRRAAKAKAPKRAGGTKGKVTSFTQAYKLSPQLSELMGADEMPRHVVVKRIYALIKEKQLYDPNNKQFVICDDALYKVIGKQRFRVFTMMKYLKTHFILD